MLKVAFFSPSGLSVIFFAIKASSFVETTEEAAGQADVRKFDSGYPDLRACCQVFRSLNDPHCCFQILKSACATALFIKQRMDRLAPKFC